MVLFLSPPQPQATIVSSLSIDLPLQIKLTFKYKSLSAISSHSTWSTHPACEVTLALWWGYTEGSGVGQGLADFAVEGQVENVLDFGGLYTC